LGIPTSLLLKHEADWAALARQAARTLAGRLRPRIG
jgi:hypothetical protein